MAKDFVPDSEFLSQDDSDVRVDCVDHDPNAIDFARAVLERVASPELLARAVGTATRAMGLFRR